MLLTKYFSGDQIKNKAEHVAHMGERRGAYRALVLRSEGKRPFGRPRRRNEDNIKMYLEEVELEGMDQNDLARG